MEKPTYRFLKDSAARGKLLEWWEWLDDNRGDRARLRRVESPDDVLMTSAFSRFLTEMPDDWSESGQLPASALVAAIVAQVKENVTSPSFAAQLATPKDGGDKPRMSELRFQPLQKSQDPTEFYRRLLRAVRILDCNVNILSLTDDILHWMHEHRKGVDRNPQNRLAFCWASDYYRALTKKQSKSDSKGGTTP